jgi:hypothetical protein
LILWRLIKKCSIWLRSCYEKEEIYYFDRMFFYQKRYKKEKAERKALADEKRNERKDNTDS